MEKKSIVRVKNISKTYQAENGEVISFEDFCKEMSEEYGL